VTARAPESGSLTRKLLIRGGTVVTSNGTSVADVLVTGPSIAGVGRGFATGDLEVLDARGLLVIPGGIDSHVHLEARTQGQRTADDFFTGTRAAAFGGTTTIIDFCYQEIGRPLIDGVAARRSAADGRAVIDYAFHLVVKKLDDSTVSELDEVVASGVTSFKAYMAYPRRGLMADDATLFRLFKRAAVLGALPVVHAESGLVTDVLIDEARAAGNLGADQHPFVHPPAGEAEGTHRALAIAGMVGSPLYFVHVSCAEALEEIEAGRRRGQVVFAETCPHYLLLDDSSYRLPDFEAAKYVMNPPLRNIANQAVLWEGLRLGRIDTVSTDHCPFDFKGQKDTGRDDFSQIPNGVPGIETRMSLLFNDGVLTGRISLEKWVEVLAAAPARIFGLPSKGRIEAGADADLVIFDPGREATITQRDQHMQVDYSLYEGKRVRGWPRIVISRGEVIVHEDVFVGAEGRGRFLERVPQQALAT
jgi:dihydropyrimidinase